MYNANKLIIILVAACSFLFITTTSPTSTYAQESDSKDYYGDSCKLPDILKIENLKNNCFSSKPSQYAQYMLRLSYAAKPANDKELSILVKFIINGINHNSALVRSASAYAIKKLFIRINDENKDVKYRNEQYVFSLADDVSYAIEKLHNRLNIEQEGSVKRTINDVIGKEHDGNANCLYELLNSL